MILTALLLTSTLSATPVITIPVTEDVNATRAPITPVEAGVAWYGDWDAALAEAQRSQRPIMLHFVRPACQGVSGVF